MRFKVTLAMVGILILSLGLSGSFGGQAAGDIILTADVYGSISIPEDNMVLDGQGFAIIGNHDGAGLWIGSRSQVTIKNVIFRNWNAAVFAHHSSSIQFENCTFQDNERGLDVEGYSHHITVLNCQFENSSLFGMLLSTGDHFSVLKNTFRNNHIGCMVQIGVSDVIFEGNVVDSNWVGVYLWENCNRWQIVGNQFSKNTWRGLNIYGSASNLVYHNNFIDNAEQALDTVPEAELWYNPDILEGNYWSDYPGRDDGSGLGKHAVAGDGIGDTDVPWANDSYPLMRPWSPVIPASITIDPKVLNKKSQGNWVTAYIELPEAYSPGNIDVTSIMLEDSIRAELKPTAIGDFDQDSRADLMVKFDRKALIALLGGRTGELTFKISGRILGQPFTGSATVKVIK